MLKAYIALTVLCAISDLWFIVRFHWTTHGDWRRSTMGVHVMAFVVVMFGLLVLSALGVLLDTFPGQAGLVIGGMVSLAGVSLWRVVILELSQKDENSETTSE